MVKKILLLYGVLENSFIKYFLWIEEWRESCCNYWLLIEIILLFINNFKWMVFLGKFLGVQDFIVFSNL